MPKIQGETTALNVISQTPIKSGEGQAARNEPNKRELVARIQAVTQQIKQKQSDIDQEAERLKEMIESGNYDAVDERQLKMVIRSLGEQVTELRDQLHQLNIDLGAVATEAGGEEGHDAGNDPYPAIQPTIVISYGYVAAAEQALNELQMAYTKLQQLQRQINADILNSQRSTAGHTGTIEALANAALNSAKADAENDYLEAGKDGAQALTTGINMGYNYKQQKNLNESLNGPDGAETRLNDAKAFKARFEDTDDADGAIGNGGMRDLEPAEQDRMRDVVEGAGPYRLEGDDGLVMDHIRADDGMRAQARENIERHIHNAELDKNSELTAFQTKMQTAGMVFQILTQAEAAGFSAGQGVVKETKKGPSEAYRSLAQYSNDQVGAAVSSGTDQARTIDQQSLELNRAKENIGSQSQRA